MAMEKILLIGSSGYVGSYLSTVLPDALDVELTTNDRRNLPTVLAPDLEGSHTDISTNNLQAFDAVLFFAGLSSVRQAQDDPSATLQANCLELLALASRLRPQQRLIYASSASVYSTRMSSVGASGFPLSSETSALPRPDNVYDASKSACDLSMTMLDRAVTGLRMGTVSGYSAGYRPELVFNAMVAKAKSGQPITLRNSGAWRAILHLEDLAACVSGLLQSELPAPPVLNVGSMNTTIGLLAERIASHLGVTVDEYPDVPTYNFALDFSLSRDYFTPAERTLEQHVDLLAEKLSGLGSV